MSELRPREMNLITGELDPQQYVQRTSLAADKQVLPLVLFCFLLYLLFSLADINVSFAQVLFFCSYENTHCI